MKEGNWPDPERPGEPEDASKQGDYLLAIGPIDTSPRRYTWVPAHDTVDGYWMPNPALSGEQMQYTARDAANRFIFLGPVPR